MRRRKDGRWDFRGQGRRSLEAAVASWVIDRLQAEGHEIEDLWSPDYDRTRRPELQTRPELAMLLDGAPAALDVTMFTTNAQSAAAARASRIKKVVEAGILAIDDPRSVFGLVVYDIALIGSNGRAQVEVDAQALAASYTDALAAIPDDQADNVAVKVSSAWARGAAISVSTHQRKRRVSINVLPRREDVAARVDEFIAERSASKVPQLAPWGHGILVVPHGFHESAQDLVDGFARAGKCPWWRVYWVGPSPEQVHQVAGLDRGRIGGGP